jgi:AcrR family transcriptional regulator
MPRTVAQNEEIREARREQILQAARQVFAEQGFHGTRMSDIAQAIGVSQGTLYHYFRNKDELFLAVLNTWNEQLETMVKQLSGSGVSSVDKLWTVSQVAVNFFETGEDLLPVLIEYWAYILHNPEAATAFRELFLTMQKSFKDILQQGIETGEFKPIDVEILSTVPLIILDGITLLTAVAGKDLINPAELVIQVQKLIFEGLLTKVEEPV